MKLLCLVIVIAAACGSAPAQRVTGDATRGAALLHDRGCLGCHGLDGTGGHSASDLGTRAARDYGIAYLAGVLWNHAPLVWAGEEGAWTFREDDAADLFAYFLSRNYFERPGDAARGKQVFTAQHCSACHGITKPVLAGANPVVAWNSVADPVAFAQAMWNGPQLMIRAFEREGIPRPVLTAQDLTDLRVYLENLPGTRGKQPYSRLASRRTGQAQFQANGCAGCHQRKMFGGSSVFRLTAADIEAAMWNHVSASGEHHRGVRYTNLGLGDFHRAVSYNEMSGIIGYLWSVAVTGDRGRGRKVFSNKKCLSCHGQVGDSPAPLFAGEGEPAPVALLAAAWRCGAAMQAKMSKRGLNWPRFAGSEMADVSAYLAGRE